MCHHVWRTILILMLQYYLVVSLQINYNVFMSHCRDFLGEWLFILRNENIPTTSSRVSDVIGTDSGKQIMVSGWVQTLQQTKWMQSKVDICGRQTNRNIRWYRLHPRHLLCYARQITGILLHFFGCTALFSNLHVVHHVLASSQY